jgi:uncharacterized tellurite resistance protein B-like protein
MADGYNKNLFARLTKLFRSGPVIRRRVKGSSSSPGRVSTAVELFKRAHSDVYNSTLSSYGAFDRMSRYSDFSEMEATPEIASALDIYAEECVSPDASGVCLHIYSENRKVQEILEGLFYETLNIEFNLVMWVRNLCKYGDFFLFNDISPDYGIMNVIPISISEIEREEGFDPDDPMAVRYRWITQGNQILENWQVSHFRLLGNDAFLPYGSSVLEAARRIWRQLILIEDAMLVYRVIRAPERRVFYIDVGNVPPEEVANYLEQAQTSLKRSQVIDKDSGKVDLRYNPLSVDEDYFLPVRGGESGTKIDTLAGGQNTAAIEDVEYIQKKLFAALKIPKAYLGYDEDVGSKATLAQEDIRFSRSIQRIQKTIIAELNKMAMIHLYSHGYEGEDLLDFTIKLSNPSSIAQQQKLELIRSKFEIAGAAPEGLVSRKWIRKNIIELTDIDIESLIQERIDDKIEDNEVEAGGAPPDEGGGEEGGGDEGGGDEEGGLFSADKPEGPLLTGKPGTGDKEHLDDDDEEPAVMSITDPDAPTKIQKQIRNIFNEPIKKSRKVTAGPEATHMPDFVKMTSVGRAGRKQDTLSKPFDNDWIKNPFKEAILPSNVEMDSFIDNKINQRQRMSRDVQRALDNYQSACGITRTSILKEAGDNKLPPEETFEVDLDNLEGTKTDE